MIKYTKIHWSFKRNFCHSKINLKKNSVAPKPQNTAPIRPTKRDTILEEGAKWLEDEGKIYDNLAAKNWLHPARPFPKNPWFVPEVPVNDNLKEEVYSTYCSDPVEWTPRKLAEKYEISILRIEAILRLKHLEKKQIQNLGYVPQTKFRSKMEQLLGCDNFAMIKESPDSSTLYGVSAKNISTILKNQEKNKKQNKSLEREDFQRRTDGNYIMPLSGIIEPPEDPPKVLEKSNPREVNSRWKFIIADISPSKEIDEAEILVRDNEGTLRTATRKERKMQQAAFPTHQTSKDEFETKARTLWDI